jgi:hypothetical protein
MLLCDRCEKYLETQVIGNNHEEDVEFKFDNPKIIQTVTLYIGHHFIPSGESFTLKVPKNFCPACGKRLVSRENMKDFKFVRISN